MLMRRTIVADVATKAQRDASERFRTAPRVLIATDISGAYGVNIKQGAVRYAAECGHWKVTCTLDTDIDFILSQNDAGKSQWNGVIAQTCPLVSEELDCRKVSEELLRRDLIAVNVSDLRSDFLACFPSVISDNTAIGHAGAEHLLKRGFRNLAFCGLADTAYANQRYEGFATRAAQAGRCVVRYAMDVGRKDLRDDLHRWLADLPRPCGVMASNDVMAKRIIDICAVHRIDVPWEIAVVGVDDDPMLCTTAATAISSVAIAAEEIGYRAARLLDELMQGATPAPSGPILIPPRSVVLRQSSDVVAVNDAVVARAIRFIHARVAQPIAVTDVAEHVGLSSRALELRFRATMGCSPSTAIRHARVDLAKKLIDSTTASLCQIAGRSGFRDQAYLSRVFRSVTGMHPQEYRDRKTTRQGSLGVNRPPESSDASSSRHGSRSSTHQNSV